MIVLWQKAVVDRIVDGEHVVLLVGDKEAEHVAPVTELPKDVAEGTWLKVRLVDGALLEVIVDSEESNTARQRVQSKMELLRIRGRRASNENNEP